MHFTKSFDLQKYLNLGGEYMNNSKNLLSNTKSLVLLGVFIALGAILMLIEIPYPPVPYLKFDCGKRGIRTPGTVTRTPHFECGPFDHSGIFPKALQK